MLTTQVKITAWKRSDGTSMFWIDTFTLIMRRKTHCACVNPGLARAVVRCCSSSRSSSSNNVRRARASTGDASQQVGPGLSLNNTCTRCSWYKTKSSVISLHFFFFVSSLSCSLLLQRRRKKQDETSTMSKSPTCWCCLCILLQPFRVSLAFYSFIASFLIEQ